MTAGYLLLSSSIANYCLTAICAFETVPLKCFAESEPMCGVAQFILYRVKSIAKGFAGLRKQLCPDTPALCFL